MKVPVVNFHVYYIEVQAATMLDDYKVNRNDDKLDVLRDDLRERVRTQRNPTDPREAEEYLINLMDTKNLRFRVLWRRNCDIPLGLITYDAHRIVFLYLHREAQEKKFGAFLLLSEAFEDIRGGELGFVYTAFSRWQIQLDMSHLLESLILLDFRRELYIDSYYDASQKELSPGEEAESMPGDFLFPDFDPEKHQDMVIETSLEIPDPLQYSLFPGNEDEVMMKRKEFIRVLLINGSTRQWERISPRASSVVLNGEGKCAGYLLFDDKKSRVVDLRVHPDYRRRGLARLMVRKVIRTVRNRSNPAIYLTFSANQKECRKALKSLGFEEITEFPVFSWSPYMLGLEYLKEFAAVKGNS